MCPRTQEQLGRKSMALPLLLWWHRYPPRSGKFLEEAALGQKSFLINQGPCFLVRLELVIPRVTLSEGRLHCPELVLIIEELGWESCWRSACWCESHTFLRVWPALKLLRSTSEEDRLKVGKQRDTGWGEVAFFQPVKRPSITLFLLLLPPFSKVG